MLLILRRGKGIRTIRNITAYLCFVFVLSVLVAAAGAPESRNQVMGEVRLQGLSKVEKTSGVWVDGQYVGYLKELKGNKRILLLPGEHTISVRQNGYQDFNDTVLVKPGQK